MNGITPFSTELKSKLVLPGCPLCRLAREDDDRYLRSLLREGLSSAGMLDRLALSGGFCGEHAWGLQRMEEQKWHDGLTNASYQRAVVAEMLASLDDTPPSRRARSRTRRAGSTAVCPACVQRVRAAQIRVSKVAEALADGPTLELFTQRREGFCLPHYRDLSGEELPEPTRRLLQELQRQQLRRLLDDLDGYIRKHHWDVHEPRLPDEETSWKDAVAMLSGQPCSPCHDLSTSE